MEEPTDFQDWELLHSSDPAVSALPSAGAPEGIESDSDEPIKSDYFALDSDRRYTRTVASGGEDDGSSEADDRGDESLPDSDNPSWVDPDSDSRYLGEPKGQLGYPGIGLRRGDPGGFWTSDESLDGRDSSLRHGEGGVGRGEGSELESGIEGLRGDAPEGEIYEVCFRGTGGIGGVEAGSENSDELGSEESPKTRDLPEASEERSIGNGDLQNLPVAERKKAGTVWWKLPLEVLKFCAFRIQPVWSVSIAVAVVAFVMLGRRLYRMRRKSRTISLKVSVDDKVSRFMVRAARLNGAFSAVKHVPVIRSPLPAPGVTPWPVMALR